MGEKNLFPIGDAKKPPEDSNQLKQAKAGSAVAETGNAGSPAASLGGEIPENNKRLKRLKQKVDIQREVLIKRLEERIKKSDLESKSKDALIRFREKLSRSSDFKLKIEKFRKKETSEAEERELQSYIDSLNVGLDEVVGQKIVEIDKFIGSLGGETTDAAVDEVKQGSSEGLEAPSSSAEAKLPVEAEVNPSEPDELEGDSSGVEVFPPEEGPEEKEKSKSERQDRLAQLKTEVDQARKEYVEMDYKKNKAHKRLVKFFGNLFDSSSNKSWEADEDVAYCQHEYERRLFEYKNLYLEDAKERGVLGKKLGAELNKFSVDDNIELADAHNQVKIERWEGTTREFVANKMQDAVEWYKKLPLSKKIAVGAVFGLATVATAGGALAGFVGYGVAGRRVFMGMVTGTTVAMGLESKTRKNMEAEKERREKEFASQLEGKSEEEIYNLIKENINNINSKQELKLGKTKNKNLRNLAAGIGVGTFIGSGAASDLFRGGWNKISEFWQNNPGGIIEGTGAADITDNNPEYPGYKDDLRSSLSETKIPAGAGVEAGASVPSSPGVASADAPSAAGVESHAETPSAATVPETGTSNEDFHKTFVGGDNVEKSIISYLDEHPEAVDKYNELNGDRGFDSGDIAHRMALKYAEEKGIPIEELDKVYPGQELELSPDGTKIMEISGSEHIGDVPEEGVLESTGEEVPEAPQAEVETGNPETDSAEETVADEAETSPTEKSDAPQTEQAPEIPAEKAENVISVPKEAMIEEFKLDDAASVKISSLNGRISDLHAQIGEIDSQINHIGIGAYPEGNFSGGLGTIDELIEKKQFLEKSAADLIDERDVTYISSIRKYVSGSDAEGWEKIKNLRAGQLMQDKKGLVYKFFEKISGENVVNFKGNINPGRGELLKDWVTRVVKIRTR